MRQSRKLKKLERQMEKSTSYDEWREAAVQHDEISGQQRWREVDQTRQYDYSQIRLRLDRLRSLIDFPPPPLGLFLRLEPALLPALHAVGQVVGEDGADGRVGTKPAVPRQVGWVRCE